MQCWTCEYVEKIPGDTHARCAHPLVKGKMASNPLGEVLSILASVGRVPPMIEPGAMEALGITLNPHGVINGWGNWPWNFDPIWVETCKGYSNHGGKP